MSSKLMRAAARLLHNHEIINWENIFRCHREAKTPEDVHRLWEKENCSKIWSWGIHRWGDEFAKLDYETRDEDQKDYRKK